MRQAFKVLTSLLFVAVVVQVGFAGYGAFNAIDKADDALAIYAAAALLAHRAWTQKT
jgi:hypothetical protein